MKNYRSRIRWKLLAVCVALAVSIVLISHIRLPENTGSGDLRPYWSASYLFAHGKDFSDTGEIDHIERVLTGWSETYTMQAWFAPLGHLILLPYTFLPFQQAVFYWLLTNIAIVLMSSVLIWGKHKNLWVSPVVSFSFSMTLVSLAVGQVNTLELLGLALFIILCTMGYKFLAGSSLILTTIKPHLVIITLPLLLLDLLRKRQWQVLAGFFVSLLICMLAFFAICPAWPASFFNLIISGMGTIRETPTLNGLLVVAGEQTLGKWMWILVLGFSVVIWLKYGKEWDQRTLIDRSILIGLIVSPVGWSYDQIMLLFPLLRVFEWVVSDILRREDKVGILVVLLGINAATFYQRTLPISDVWFFWVPIVVSLVYVYTWRQHNKVVRTTRKGIMLGAG